jgi:hypothetical protein
MCLPWHFFAFNKEMNPWNYFYAALVVLALYFLFPSQERMTNADLLSTLKTFGTQTPTPKTPGPSEVPLFGPRAEKPDDAPSDSSGANRLNIPLTGEYPEIFGPDSVLVPGSSSKKKCNNSKHTSDGDKCEDAYDYNPDLAKAFPTSGPPEPYLTDFSKLHH